MVALRPPLMLESQDGSVLAGPTCFCEIPRPEALQNLFGTYAIHL